MIDWLIGCKSIPIRMIHWLVMSISAFLNLILFCNLCSNSLIELSCAVRWFLVLFICVAPLKNRLLISMGFIRLNKGWLNKQTAQKVDTLGYPLSLINVQHCVLHIHKLCNFNSTTLAYSHVSVLRTMHSTSSLFTGILSNKSTAGS